MAEREAENNKNIDHLPGAIYREEDGAPDRPFMTIYPGRKRLAHFQFMKERPGHPGALPNARPAGKNLQNWRLSVKSALKIDKH